ncbi:MAG: zinc-ribbon domain-containing protein [Candidatus Bathyarchaeota archaeon]|nr:zinc-ribbon domain-containing protein [Candidatus Bathyarchaeota archaeon]
MVYCSNCGSKIDDESFFCPKCGTRTPKGKAANAAYPTDELRDAFYQVGVEVEKAFTLAAHEMHAAFKRVSEDINQKHATTQGGTICSKCGTRNPEGSDFCSSCGAKIETEASTTTT